ncbi:DNA methyltransferase [Nostoc sp.]|uniref:DNA methyltransferase n=1 Tax=Nostoc sp. TaxID=1180 RepID=UPI002FFC75B9
MDSEQLSLNIQIEANSPQQTAVECLGMAFESDEERRAYFIEKLREKLQDPEFRQIEGFPIGEDEDILALSDPPYYTACPNPFIEDFINYWHQEKDNSSSSETDEYHREPFAADVSEGKNDPIYNAHSYHTKVPHKAIMRYILHYTEPGDIVFDGFCGTGMTGVAAQLCGDKATVESLGYKVQADGTILDEEGKAFSKLGARCAILNDLSPAATFIAYNYNTPVDVSEFEKEAKRILAEVEKECGWMYLTLHNPNPEQIERGVSLLKKSNNPQVDIQNSRLSFGKINYTVWSDVFTCPECAGEVVYWEASVDKQAGKVQDNFSCPHCNAQLTKRNMERAWVTRFDTAINETVRQAKQVPVFINYSVGNKRYDRVPDIFDLTLIETIENNDIPYLFPKEKLPDGDKTCEPLRIGISHTHHFYTKRNLWVFASFINASKNTKGKNHFLGVAKDCQSYATKMVKLNIQRLLHGGGQFMGFVSGTLYIPSLNAEQSTLNSIISKVKKVLNNYPGYPARRLVKIDTSSSTVKSHFNSSIDYIFTDPPFGSNLMYSELNFLWEAWLKVFTYTKLEAIENKVQGKGLLEYQELMTQCFHNFYQLLKPGRWITVEFHNSKNSVWTSIQEAIQKAGFIIADVRTLDKKQGSFNQVAGGGNTVRLRQKPDRLRVITQIY